jgi:hypothetical protein
MSTGRWYVQCHERWVLHCEYSVYSYWSGDVLGIYQTGSHAHTGAAVAGLENCAVDKGCCMIEDVVKMN